MDNNIFEIFKPNNDTKKDSIELTLLSKIISYYNKMIYKYTGEFIGAISIPKTELSDIPKEFMSIKEYISSNKNWKQILKFSKESNIEDINDYIEVMIRNWNTIKSKCKCQSLNRPNSKMIFSLKMLGFYDQFRYIENKSKDKNDIIITNKDDNDFYRLNPTNKNDINTLFRLKRINNDLNFSEIVTIFNAEFEQKFIDLINKTDEKDITEEYLKKHIK